MLGPDNEFTEQELSELENMTDGQLADYLAEQAINEPNI